nr:hypothetical protein [Desulfobacterales bacterium]
MGRLANQGEQILASLPSKSETMIFAQQLTDKVSLSEAKAATGELSILEDTPLKKGLIHSLGSTVAFHHADLRITTVVALGINLPATVVFLDARKWESDDGG